MGHEIAASFFRTVLIRCDVAFRISELGELLGRILEMYTSSYRVRHSWNQITTTMIGKRKLSAKSGNFLNSFNASLNGILVGDKSSIIA